MREGRTYSGYVSPDGAGWMLVGRHTISPSRELANRCIHRHFRPPRPPAGQKPSWQHSTQDHGTMVPLTGTVFSAIISALTGSKCGISLRIRDRTSRPTSDSTTCTSFFECQFLLAMHYASDSATVAVSQALFRRAARNGNGNQDPGDFWSQVESPPVGLTTSAFLTYHCVMVPAPAARSPEPWEACKPKRR